MGGEKIIYQDKRLRECNYGLLDGKPNSTVIYEDHIIESFPEGESMQDVEKRLREFCKYVLEEFDGKHIAIVAHKAPQLAIQVVTENKTYSTAEFTPRIAGLIAGTSLKIAVTYANIPEIISVPYDLEGLQQGALFIVPSGLDDGKGRVFRCTKLSNIMVYPASVSCEIVPEYENTFRDFFYENY